MTKTDWWFLFLICSSLMFLNIMLNLFLTLFSVRPGISLIISDHLFPIDSLFSRIKISSCREKGSFLISGFKKLTHRSRHCLPFLWTLRFSFSWLAIWLHCLVPFSRMSFTSSSSSLLTQFDFLMVDFLSWLNLYWHCESFLPGINPAIWIQSFLSSFWGTMFLPEQYFLMAQSSSFDSSSVQFYFA